MHVVQTAGEPPNRGSSSLANIGCTRNSSSALTNIAAAKRRVIGLPTELSDYRAGGADAVISDPSPGALFLPGALRFPKMLMPQGLDEYGSIAGGSGGDVGSRLSDIASAIETELRNPTPKTWIGLAVFFFLLWFIFIRRR